MNVDELWDLVGAVPYVAVFLVLILGVFALGAVIWHMVMG